MRHPFLSDAWFDALEALRPELPEPPVEVSDLMINLTITGAPGGDVPVHMHAGIPDRGHHGDAPTLIVAPYELVRSLFVAGDPKGVITAFLGGKLTVSGDMSQLVALQSMAPTLGEPTPEQRALFEKVQQITAV